MLKKLMTIAPLAGLLCCASISYSQALPTATAKGALQVGGGWSFVRPDYGQKSIQGVTGFADFDFHPNFGVEVEYHYISLVTPTDLGENSVLAGPRFVLPRGRFNYYAKAVAGVGTIVIQEVQDNPEGGAGSYFAYGIGVGVDYRVSKHLVARADYEYQHWNYRNGLTPTGLTLGLAYRFR